MLPATIRAQTERTSSIFVDDGHRLLVGVIEVQVRTPQLESQSACVCHHTTSSPHPHTASQSVTPTPTCQRSQSQLSRCCGEEGHGRTAALAKLYAKLCAFLMKRRKSSFRSDTSTAHLPLAETMSKSNRR